MKRKRIELYFVLYLTAIMSFFAVNQLVNDWKKKENERRNQLIATIQRLVDIGDIFVFDIDPTKNPIQTKYIVNSYYDIKEPYKNLVFITKDSLNKNILYSDTSIVNITSREYYFSSKMFDQARYKIFLRILEPGLFTISEEGRNHIKRKLRDLFPKNKEELDTLLNTIISNLEKRDLSKKLFSYTIDVFVPEPGTRNPPLQKGPFISGNEFIPENTKSKARFYYGNFTKEKIEEITFTIRNNFVPKIKIDSVRNNQLFITVPPLKNGRYKIKLGTSSKNINCTATIVSVKSSIATENDTICMGSTLKADINTIIPDANVVWSVLCKKNNKNWSGYGKTIRIDNYSSYGKYLITASTINNNELSRSYLYIRNPKIKIDDYFNNKTMIYDFVIYSDCPNNYVKIYDLQGIKLIKGTYEGACPHQWSGIVNKNILNARGKVVVYFMVEDKYGGKKPFQKTVKKSK